MVRLICCPFLDVRYVGQVPHVSRVSCAHVRALGSLLEIVPILIKFACEVQPVAAADASALLVAGLSCKNSRKLRPASPFSAPDHTGTKDDPAALWAL